MRTVICFGGSFNPPHQAHLKIALSALRQLKAAEVWFIPSLQPPLKDTVMAPFEDRCAMVERMIRPYRKLKVCRIEAGLPIPSYTIETVRHLTGAFTDTRFIWLIGSDQAHRFNQWKDAEQLAHLIRFAVYRRDPEDEIPAFMHVLESDLLKEASRDIRKTHPEGSPLSVRRYFTERELYLESIAKACVSERRWTHIKAMTELALRLGSAHGLDLHQVYIAALFHDCAKSWPQEKLKAWLAFCEPAYVSQPAALWHQVVGAEWVKRTLGIRDQAILKAIRHHSDGLNHDPLTQVIFIADKCDETRGYDATEDLKVAYRDLEKGYVFIRDAQLAYMTKKGIIRE